MKDTVFIKGTVFNSYEAQGTYSKGEFINMSEESHCDRKDEDVPKEGILAKIPH